MAKIDTLTLRVRAPEAQRRFYRDILGMSELEDGRVAYSSREVALKFIEADEPYVARPSDLYWKIAVSVPNIELAREQLIRQGIDCTEPQQFRDVGYLVHFVDPEGFTVELIDHWFKGERPHETHNEELFGGGAHLSLVTLRTADIAAIEPELVSWGMTPLSVQSVDPPGFTLYFYGFTAETPPKSDLEAIENRSWVYRRSYTVLELQHLPNSHVESPQTESVSGYGGLSISSVQTDIQCEQLRICSELATS